MRKLMAAFMAITLLFAVTAPGIVDAKKRSGGGFSSGVKKYNPAPTKNDSGVSSTNKANQPTNKATTTTPPKTSKPSFGGSFLKGMMIGGLAGMLFGGLFGDMGMLGNILGLMVNVFAIVLLFMVASIIFRKWRDSRKARSSHGGFN
ncbi:MULTISPECIES: hypothetical protein [Paenibacillus]|uniref:Preprotein translocase subunit Tim44 n=1 Tax=Paenibacillus arenosi TaxID=2774142 RepID=A0ABR9ATS6_9BACL|nr:MULTISPECIES: hypothetical protein [Paenibacillus]MBD8497521.1 hypothetical protein [Paenibacillus arenosi]